MGKVLIIDDENQLRGLLARIIGLEGYEVIQADSCKAGLKQVEQQNPDVIICDVRLPDGSGVDLITEMKRLGPLTEIILLTAHGNIPDGVQAIKNGAFDYITKGDDNNNYSFAQPCYGKSRDGQAFATIGETGRTKVFL